MREAGLRGCCPEAQAGRAILHVRNYGNCRWKDIIELTELWIWVELGENFLYEYKY